ncbi:MAG: ABC transporter substrate-binding protein [Planctomycetaceae bacterium]
MKIGFTSSVGIESCCVPIIAAASHPDAGSSDAGSSDASATPGKIAEVTAAEVTAAEVTTADAAGVTLLSTRFKRVEADSTGTLYLRERPEPDGLDPGKYHVAEVREKNFSNRDELIKAVIRGEIDYLPQLLPWEVDAFKASPAFEVRQYALPITHVITFNPLSERIVNAQMRRALSFALNREAILKSIVLRDQSMRYGRPTSAPWHLQSYATNPLEKPPEFNLRLAYALRYAAERQLQLAELTKLETEAKAKAKEAGDKFESEEFRKVTNVDYIKLPRLRMVIDPDPTAAEAAKRMTVYWEKIGFEIDLIPGEQPGTPLTDTDWDLCYRRIRMEEPLLELWPLLTNDSSFDMNRLKLFPDWMRQELVNLDYSASFVDAQDRLFTIHRHMSAEAFIIPLWEVDEFAVWKKSTLGIPERPMSPYQNVERWIVRP